jgi:hypothetical protein
MASVPSNHPMREDAFSRFNFALLNVQNDPRSLVLVTNGFLELLVEAIIREKCKNRKKVLGDNRSWPYGSKLLLLNEMGAISPGVYRDLDWFRSIRNDAAHNPFFEITTETLQQVRPEVLGTPPHFFHLCAAIFANLWNGNIEIFGPIFSPNFPTSVPWNQLQKPPERTILR